MFVVGRVARWLIFESPALIDPQREHDDTLHLMPCLLPILAVFFPRFVIIMIAVFTRWFSAAFDTALWPILGFLFMPYTTLAYMAAMLNNNHSVSGGWMVLVIIAALVDLGHHHFARRTRWRRRQ